MPPLEDGWRLTASRKLRIVQQGIVLRESLMYLPVIRGLIERRILANYRVDPQVVERLLPTPFRPQLVEGYAIAGICLIRLSQVRPRSWPAWTGIGSENAAHRFAVEWEERGAVRTGVFIRRRDSNSWLNSLAGGRIFPGVHHHARFDVREQEDRFHVALRSDDGETHVAVTAHLADSLPASVFSTLGEAAAFFQSGSLGYSPNRIGNHLQGLELSCQTWRLEPLAVEAVSSSLFDDTTIFPAGSAEFDSAFLMRNIEHEWHQREELCCGSVRAPLTYSSGA